ncbi:N-acetylmuramoyl-L-alanine amidase [Spirosoma taeanense]|uniref:N-acetylmuramoyl-L-alanine amidase n=1 Tax=Spirosoma taeanense TaxID=2735870 RepID=A0A6M5YCD9_9BACT|nr:N-acetylmuramoyl-L-alanine amidase [Spirosoma taeanense]QJW90582.1 N-acetylmuramoyl-L-alanine amidase [Spirosoma taeanense]
MSHSLIWLPSVLNDAGLKVALVDGWETRGRGDVGTIFGVICHHTAGVNTGNMPSLKTLINGRSDLPGPLAQLGLGRDGTYYVIAAGRCNHAGVGSFRGLSNGNKNFIGIEAENTGLGSDFPWPDIQMDAYHRGVAAILKHLGRGAGNCCAHKEYALPAGRKNDPLFNMNSFRSRVAELLNDGVPARPRIPSIEPTGGRPTLRRGKIGMPEELIKLVQQKVGVSADGNFGPKTEAAVRVFQRDNGLVPDGIVGPKTWLVLK